MSKKSLFYKYNFLYFFLLVILGFVLILLFEFSSLCSPLISFKVQATTSPQPHTQVTVTEPYQLTQQGREHYQSGQYEAAIDAWQIALDIYVNQGDRLNQAMVLNNLASGYQQINQWEDANQAVEASLNLLHKEAYHSQDIIRILAQALTNQGNLQLAQGHPQVALNNFHQATDLYRQVHDEEGVIRAKINEAQVLRTLGFYRQARTVLEQVNHLLQEQPDSIMKAVGLHNLGNILRLMGHFEESYRVLEESLAIARLIESVPDINAALLSLGNTAQFQENFQEALSHYQEAVVTAPSELARLEALVNQFSLLIDLQNVEGPRRLWPQIQNIIEKIQPSRASIYAQINAVHNLERLRQVSFLDVSSQSDILNILAQAVQQAQQLGDQKAESYALGYLGQQYERSNQWSYAQQLTDHALNLALTINEPSTAYLWQWQLGRLFKAQGKIQEAIVMYQQAVESLQTMRQDLVAFSPTVRFSFRDSVEPVYRELVSLLLLPLPSESLLSSESKQHNQTNKEQSQIDPQSERLNQARQTIELLQLAELDNFFQQACLEVNPVILDDIDTKAAVIYPVLQNDEVVIIASLPNNRFLSYGKSISSTNLEAEVKRLQEILYEDPIENRFRIEPLLNISQQLYDLIIRPVEAALHEEEIETLVFVLDGVLRTVPMAVLHDGQHYLIENYNISVSPGLQLLNPQSFGRRRMKAIIGGLGQSYLGFPPLPNVREELEAIRNEIPDSQIFLDESFTKDAIQNELQNETYPIVHLATHGQFSSDAQETFILTSNGKINVNELSETLQSSDLAGREAIELLVLSACQTAAGDDRATLGLAGVAFRSGARSTIATLWPVTDKATALLMSKFYEQLSATEITKAQALRNAQLKLLRDHGNQFENGHPFFWAPYLLIGNWL